ncbi:hypothetical protein UFOVP755_86 [uncultured Caudovirales phage]|uniref:Uncharacterized protein n=1 Tax=uncultured Caudovirales phage TaxID=2100421 RepID=A0A6J7X967_9CAUD|nr:hypothetical protein UFOVP755_86 [uncultured Caudovirales phage]
MNKIALTIVGKYQDTLIDKNGNVKTHEIKNNQVQLTALKLISSLFKNQANTIGIQYIALGSGDATWDLLTNNKPSPMLNSNTTLTTEVFRKAIPTTDIVFVDPTAAFGQGAISQTATTRLRITTQIEANQANTSLREFALFGGNATGMQDSGFMINWVAHPLIEKTDDVVLNRMIELDFVLVNN